jgi:membrane protease YdiL (CAAX protease family)
LAPRARRAKNSRVQQLAGAPGAPGGKGTKAGGSDGGAPGGGGVANYLRQTRSGIGAAALTLPLLALHGLGGIVAEEVRNGADIISVGLAAAFSALDLRGALPYAAFYGVVVLVQAVIIAFLASKGRLSRRWLLPFLAECAVYAIAAGTLSSWLTSGILDAVANVLPSHIAPLATTAAAAATTAKSVIGPMDAVLLSFGAGFHEELVFRLGGIGLMARWWGGPSWRSRPMLVLLMLIVSSLLFSAAHHLVEPFALGVFTFRTAMGLLFGALFLARGFAVVAWTHALFDIWVLLVMAQ